MALARAGAPELLLPSHSLLRPTRSSPAAGGAGCAALPHCTASRRPEQGPAPHALRADHFRPRTALHQAPLLPSLAAQPPAASSPLAPSAPCSRGAVAFFDVDGTLVASNVVSAFAALKLSTMSPAEKALWVPYFVVQVGLYLLLDRLDRGLFNRVFYRNYRGIPVGQKHAMANLVHSHYLLPRLFPQALDLVRSLRARGFGIVLVSGSLDFLIQPLADELQCEAVFAARLEEEHGRFSGELEGAAVSSREKAEVVVQYAKEQGLDLSVCHAYGDSIADLDMLKAVGCPHAVCPDSRLERVARAQGWPVLRWGQGQSNSSAEASQEEKPKAVGE